MDINDVLTVPVVTAYLLAVLTASVVYRRARGRPVLFFNVRDADFIQRTASGCCADTWWRMLGGARNCLVVAVKGDHLIVRPWFPFNLGFLPEIYGLDHEIPIQNITTVHENTGWFSRGVRVAFSDNSGRTRELQLVVRNPGALIECLGGG